jgi:tellurite resistance protein TehA-like permease
MALETISPGEKMRQMSIRKVIDLKSSNLDPGCFAVVMATGVVSIACALQGMPRIAWGLFQINKIVYLILLFLLLWRLARHLPRLAADLMSHNRGPGFLTSVASGLRFFPFPSICDSARLEGRIAYH